MSRFASAAPSAAVPGIAVSAAVMRAAIEAETARTADELEEYLAGQLQDPRFREAYEAAGRRHRRAWHGPLAVDGREYRRRQRNRIKRRRR